MSQQQNNENSPLRRSFENKEDFIKYYNEHKEDMDKLTTKQLNSAYVIDSCKITKIKNKIVVRSNSPKNKAVKDNKDNKVKPKQKKQTEQKDIIKMIDSLINHYEKQLISLKEMKNKIVSDELYDSDHDN